MSVVNPDQLNSDGNFIDNSPPYAPGVDDRTRVNSDGLGDVCDPTMITMAFSDTAENASPPCIAAGGPTNPVNADTDGDRYLDGAECGRRL